MKSTFILSEKKIKISISVDPLLDKNISEMSIDKKFYKKSRLIEYILKKYTDEEEKKDTL